MWIALNSAITVRPTQLRTSVAVMTLCGGFKWIHTADISTSLSSRNDNRCDTYVPLFDGLRF